MGGHDEAVHHGGDGGKAGDSARLQPRKPLAEAAQEQDAAMAVRGSGEVRPLGRGDFGNEGGESKVQRRELQPARLGRQPTGEPVRRCGAPGRRGTTQTQSGGDSAWEQKARPWLDGVR